MTPQPGLTVRRGVLALGFLLVLLGGALTGWFAGASPFTALGTSDPGALVRLGTPVVRGLADIAAALTVGALTYAVLVSVRRGDGGLTGLGYAAVRSASRWSLLWAVTTAAMVPFSFANASGQSLGRGVGEVFGGGDPFPLLAAMETPLAWLVTAVLAAVVALGCRFTLRWQPVVALLLIGLVAVLPPLVTGHASAQGGHDVATGAIVVHVPAAVLWGGLLVCLLRPAWRAGVDLARYRRVAATAWLVLVVSGAFDAAMFVPEHWLSTQYGRLLLVKVGLVAILGVVGLFVRRHRVAPVIELALLAVAGGASVGLAYLAPPSFIGIPNDVSQTLLGYDLSGPPTAAALFGDWRFDPLLGSVAIVLAGVYVVGVIRLRRRGESWPAGRTAMWLAGCVVLLLATSSGIGRYAAAMFSVHLASHMLISMLAPVLLAVGGPLTLWRAVRPRPALDALAGSTAVRVLTQPIVALVLFGGAPFLLYFTSIFDAAVRFHWAHLAINVVFLLIGYFFAWCVVGVDPTPRPSPTLARLGMLLAAMPADIVFGALVTTTDRVIGNGPAGANMYSALAVPWVSDLLVDQRLAGELALIIGEASLLVAILALLVRWKQIDRELDGMEEQFRALAPLR